ncbi:hypothetical protein D3Z38_18370 [Clostridiales bacterium]|nr:hypothetical protein [Clostridiales bacterium]
MEELTSVVLSGIAWDAIKKGIKISTNYLKKRLSNWILDDDKLEEISKYMGNIPDAYCMSEGMIKEYLNLNERLLDILKEAKPTGSHISQTIEKNYGLNVGLSTGTINQTNYYSEEKPRDIAGEKFSLIEDRTKFNSVPIVKSFCSTRDQCIMENDVEPSVYADIMIPMDVKKREGCQFSMILFSYIPSENWLNYFDAGYRIKFFMETSDSIRQVQFQIKNSSQQQFVDIPLKEGVFDYTMKDISKRESWKDIREISFVVFADDGYIMGENGFIRIKGLRLEK